MNRESKTIQIARNLYEDLAARGAIGAKLPKATWDRLLFEGLGMSPTTAANFTRAGEGLGYWRREPGAKRPAYVEFLAIQPRSL